MVIAKTPFLAQRGGVLLFIRYRSIYKGKSIDRICLFNVSEDVFIATKSFNKKKHLI